MSKKETIVKHAEKTLTAALRIFLLSMILLGGRGTLMTVHAVNEMQLPGEDAVTPEQQTEILSEEPAQIQEENAEEALQAQPENTLEEQPQGENMEETDQAAEAAPTLEAMSITMVGDSIMYGATPSIQQLLPNCVIDAKVGRQMPEADAVLDSLEQQNAVGEIVVIELGTNGPFSVAKGQELIDRLGSDRTIYWVTVYGTGLSWQEESNATIRTLAANNENVHLIEWAQAVPEHTEWLRADGIHLSGEGRAAFAGVVLGGLSQQFPICTV